MLTAATGTSMMCAQAKALLVQFALRTEVSPGHRLHVRWQKLPASIQLLWQRPKLACCWQVNRVSGATSEHAPAAEKATQPCCWACKAGFFFPLLFHGSLAAHKKQTNLPAPAAGCE